MDTNTKAALAFGSLGTAAFVLPRVFRPEGKNLVDNTPPLGALIETRGLLANHAGVYVGTQGDTPRAVAHCKKWGYWRIDSIEDWAPDGRYWVVGKPHPTPEQAVRRALSIVGRPYSLFGYNCEHAAHWAATGSLHSPQLAQAAVIGVISVAAFMVWDVYR